MQPSLGGDVVSRSAPCPSHQALPCCLWDLSAQFLLISLEKGKPDPLRQLWKTSQSGLLGNWKGYTTNSERGVFATSKALLNNS